MGEPGSDITQYDDPSSPGWQSATPVAKHLFSSGQAIYDAIKTDEASWGGAVMTVSGDIMALGTEAYGAVTDPLGWLIGVGLDFLLAYVEPLNYAITWLSGNPGDMQDLIGVWENIQQALLSLAEEVDQAWATTLESNDETTNLVRDKVNATSAAISAVAADTASVQQLLARAQMLSTFIFEVVKSILSTLVQRLIIWGLAALAAAYFTAGSSVATFLAKAAGWSAKDTVKAGNKMKYAGTLADALKEIGSQVARSTFRAKGHDHLMWAGNVLGSTMAGASSTSASNYSAGLPSGGSGGGGVVGIDVDPAEYEFCAEELSRLTTNSYNIHSKVGETGTDFMTWGIACLAFSSFYNDKRSDLLDDTATIAPALEGNGSRLRDCAADLRDCDSEVASDLETAAEDLE
jgi:hypothetical protein